MKTIPITDDLAIVATIDPDVTAAGTVVSDWIDVKEFMNFSAIVMAGTLGTNATLDAKLRRATDSSGTGAEDIPDKAITQLTQAGDDDSDKQAIINLNPEDLGEGFTHFALSIAVGTATSDVGGLVIGKGPRNKKPADADLASVAEIVA